MLQTFIYFAVFIVMNFAVSFGVQGVATIIYGTGHTTTDTELLIMSGLNSVIIVALFFFTKWCPMSRNYVRTRPWGMFFWVILFALGSILPLAWLEELVPEAMRTDIAGEQIARMLGTSEGYFVICMLAPLAEEVVFRGAIIRAVVRWGEKRREKKGEADASKRFYEWTAIVLSAVLFAVVHLNPAQIPHALIAGVVLGWLFVKTGSIVPGFLLHWINNSAAYVVLKMFPTQPLDASLLDYFQGNTMALYQALGSSLLIALPALYQLIRMKRVEG